MRKIDAVLRSVLSPHFYDDCPSLPEDEQLTFQEADVLYRFFSELSEVSVFDGLMTHMDPLIDIDCQEKAHLWIGIVKLKNLLEM